MHVLLVTATALEMRAVLSGLSGLPPFPALSAGPCFPLPQADMGHATVHFLIGGVGPVSSAASLGACLSAGPGPRKGEAEFDLVLNFGVAGSYDLEKAPLGCLVRATEEVWPEYGLATGETILPQGIQFAQAELKTGPVYQRIKLWSENTLGNLTLTCHTPLRKGVSVTVAGVSGTPDQARRIQERTGGIIENMEGFGLALSTAMVADAGETGTGIPFMELRAVSNQAGYRPPLGWDMPAALNALSAAGKSIFARHSLTMP